MNLVKKYKIYLSVGLVILAVILVFVFYNPKNDSFGFKCPSDFKTPEEYTDSVAKWVSEYAKEHSEAKVEEMMAVRDKLIEKYKCGKSPFAVDDNAENNIDTEKLMAGIKYAESQREDEAADAVIKTTSEKELYDNPYIKHLRKAFNGYLDGTNNGVEEGVTEKSELEGGLKCGLDSFDRDYYKSEFTIIKTEKNDYGGIVAYSAFLNQPDKVFWAWVYQYSGGEYILRGFCEYAALIEQ